MRFVCGLVFCLFAMPNLWAQMEPCLAGTDSPDCGIKIEFSRPAPAADENTILIPNSVTIDVPLRLRPKKILVNNGPVGSVAAEQFKFFAENTHYKKAGGVARFQLAIKDCPKADTALSFNIVTQRFPYPIVVTSRPLECKQAQ